MKNYQVNGLSQNIHEKEGAIYKVSGPMGRSLGVDLNGLNVVFAAGTGVLPFMDMIGYLARQTLGIEDVDSEQFTPNFFLWFNVRLNSEEALGDELLSALAQANTTQFKYDAVRKNIENPPSSSRWTEQSITDKLAEIEQETGGKTPINIWVCGTPSMN